jgi:hypothetical protein
MDFSTTIPFSVVAITVAVVIGVIAVGVVLVNMRAKKIQKSS